MRYEFDRVRARWFAARVGRQICKRTEVTPRELFGPRRYAGIARARKLAYYLVRLTSGASWPAIGRAFRRHHATCLLGARAFERELATDPHARALLANVLQGDA